MRRAGALLIGLLAALAPAGGSPAGAQELVADLSRHVIQITSDFSGTELLVFGAVGSADDADIVVVVRGPRDEVVVRKKARVMGVWINARSAAFRSTPGFYGVAATRPLEEIGGAEMRRLAEIGLDALRLDPDPDLDAGEIAEFRRALIEVRQAEGLFPTEPAKVDVVGGRLFRARIPFPAGVPVGAYVADTFLVRGGEIVAAQSSPLVVDKAGFGADIHDFAHREASLYGLLAVAAAAVAGLAGNVLFRRP